MILELCSSGEKKSAELILLSELSTIADTVILRSTARCTVLGPSCAPPSRRTVQPAPQASPSTRSAHEHPPSFKMNCCAPAIVSLQKQDRTIKASAHIYNSVVKQRVTPKVHQFCVCIYSVLYNQRCLQRYSSPAASDAANDGDCLRGTRQPHSNQSATHPELSRVHLKAQPVEQSLHRFGRRCTYVASTFGASSS